MGLSDQNPIIQGGTDGTNIGNLNDTLNTNTVGNIASAVADSGNPVKVGAKYNATPPTFTDGNRTDLQSDVNGNLKIIGIASENTFTDINAVLTTTGASTGQLLGGSSMLTAYINVSAVSGTTPVMQLSLQQSIDNSVWEDVFMPPPFTATGTYTVPVILFGHKYYRWSYTITGTTPSFTTAITTFIRAGMPPTYIRAFVDTINLNAQGNTSTIRRAPESKTITLQMNRAATGGGGAKVAIAGSIDGVNFFTTAAETANINAGASGSITLSNTAYVFFRAVVTANQNSTGTIFLFSN